MNQRRIDEIVLRVRNERGDDGVLAEAAVDLAVVLLEAGRRMETRGEKRQGGKLARMMEDAPGKAFTLAMADRVFRPYSAGRSASLFRHLVESFGVPEYLSFAERAAMAVGARVSAIFPGLVMPAVTGAVRRQSAAVILAAEEEKLKRHLRERRAEWDADESEPARGGDSGGGGGGAENTGPAGSDRGSGGFLSFGEVVFHIQPDSSGGLRGECGGAEGEDEAALPGGDGEFV